jgi:hypothetical protein
MVGFDSAIRYSYMGTEKLQSPWAAFTRPSESPAGVRA